MTVRLCPTIYVIRIAFTVPADLQRPLYAVSGGDLGVTAASVDRALTTIFKISSAWKALVLIDEADVFMEERSLHDLERNAMVAVFLRQLE